MCMCVLCRSTPGVLMYQPGVYLWTHKETVYEYLLKLSDSLSFP